MRIYRHACMFFCLLLILFAEKYEASAAVSNGRVYRSGTVVSATGCKNRFAVITDNGYSIIDWVGGQPVIEEDYLTGNLERIGPTTLQNVTRKTTVQGIIEFSLLNEEEFRKRNRQVCR